MQVDYNLPERFDLSYVGADNQPHRPVMIHRAPFGSLERFTGLLIEHFAGEFPTWLAPEQVRVLPISEKFLEAAEAVDGAARRGRRPGLGGPRRRTRSVPRFALPGSTGSPICSSSEAARWRKARSPSATATVTTSAQCHLMILLERYAKKFRTGRCDRIAAC